MYPEFRESNFRELIHAVAESRPVRDSRSVNSGELLLRFDIDYSLFSIPPILKVLSEFEGLSASFYILVDSSQYNVFNRTSRAIIDDVIDHGYEVGLHFNPPPAELVRQSMQFEFDLQKETLTRAIDKKLYSYSTHFPSVFGFFQSKGDERNLYSEPYFGLGRYISDSSHADPRRILGAMDGNEDSVFQLLLHPENYFGSKLTYASNLYEHFGMLYSQLLLDFEVNSVMQKELGETSSLRELLNLIDK